MVTSVAVWSGEELTKVVLSEGAVDTTVEFLSVCDSCDGLGVGAAEPKMRVFWDKILAACHYCKYDKTTSAAAGAELGAGPGFFRIWVSQVQLSGSGDIGVRSLSKGRRYGAAEQMALAISGFAFSESVYLARPWYLPWCA